MDTIVEGRSPTRKALLVPKAIEELKKWSGICNTYRSVYRFNQLTPRGTPDWDTAIIDTVALDVDVLSNKRGMHDESVISQIIKWCRDNDYTREYVFTGGGYNVFIDIENATREKLYEAHYYLRNDMHMELDPAAIDIARGTRFIPSYNFNKKAFAAYITEEEALMPFKDLHARMQHPRKGRIPKIGQNKWNVKKLKSGYADKKLIDPGPVALAKQELAYQDFETRYGKICDTILSIGRKKDVGHNERYFIILYIKDVLKVPYSEFDAVYKYILGPRGDYYHSTRDEQQPRYAYAAFTRFNPHVFKKFGYCDRDCNECIDKMCMDADIMKGVLT